MKVSIVVLNWNGEKYISHCLDSLKNLLHTSIEIEKIVVDNDSTDNSVELIKNQFSDCVLLRNPTNLGYAQGNNIGIKYALRKKADFIWILNSDIIVEKSSLIKHIEATALHPNVGIFGCKIYFAPGYEFHKDRYTKNDLGRVIWYAGGQIDWKNVISSHRGVDEIDKGQFDEDVLTDYVTGASMFVRSDVFERVGLFDPNFFLYFEETDFCQRAMKHGYKNMYISSPVVWHENAQATGMGSPLQDYFITRNRLLFGLKYAPLRAKQALIRESINIYRSGRVWQKQAVVDFFVGRLGKGTYK